MRRDLAIIAMCVIGCTADLQRVHTPDLFTVSERDAKRAMRGGRRTMSHIADREHWAIYGSLEPIEATIDLDPSTVAVPKAPESKDQFLLLDLGCLSDFNEVAMTHPDDHRHPRRLRVDVAGDHNFPYELAYTGDGSPRETLITLPRTIRARFLRITVLDVGPSGWAVNELSLR
jgi:hypothetical protein